MKTIRQQIIDACFKYNVSQWRAEGIADLLKITDMLGEQKAPLAEIVKRQWLAQQEILNEKVEVLHE